MNTRHIRHTVTFIVQICMLLHFMSSMSAVQAQGMLQFATMGPATPTPTGNAAQQVSQVPSPQVTDAQSVDIRAKQPYLCFNDKWPEQCDNQAFILTKGSGGSTGTCGSVVGMSQLLLESAPYIVNGPRDALDPAVTTPCFTANAYPSGYISTFFISDAYNLAGYHDIDKSNPLVIRGLDLMNWMKSESNKNYQFEPYVGGDQLQKNLTGTVIFINLSSGAVHPAIVNSVDIYDAHGNGMITVFQTGSRYLIDRFEILNGQIVGTPLFATGKEAIAGFGRHI